MFEGDTMLKRIIPFAHETILDHINKDSIVIDMTCGNGHDTLFLCQNAKHVYAFDIQEDAIKQSKETTIDYDNVTYICDSHEFVSQYISTPIDCAMYNLGYLPKGDTGITTKSSSTLASLDNVLPLLKKNGLISITIYIGHEQGKKEAIDIEAYVAELPAKKYQVIRYQTLNTSNSPYNIFIQRLGK
jgi:tRNA G37 N-methylase Trm5